MFSSTPSLILDCECFLRDAGDGEVEAAGDHQLPATFDDVSEFDVRSNTCELPLESSQRVDTVVGLRPVDRQPTERLTFNRGVRDVQAYSGIRLSLRPADILGVDGVDVDLPLLSVQQVRVFGPEVVVGPEEGQRCAHLAEINGQPSADAPIESVSPVPLGTEADLTRCRVWSEHNDQR